MNPLFSLTPFHRPYYYFAKKKRSCELWPLVDAGSFPVAWQTCTQEIEVSIIGISVITSLLWVGEDSYFKNIHWEPGSTDILFAFLIECDRLVIRNRE